MGFWYVLTSSRLGQFGRQPSIIIWIIFIDHPFHYGFDLYE